MKLIRRTIELDATTDARLRALAAERGKDEAAVLAEAVALLHSVIEIDAPDLGEDQRRLARFATDGEAVPLHEVKAWVQSWGSDHELPPPSPRRLG